MKKFIFIVMIFVVMGISWFNPVFVLTSRAAALSSFVAATTVANVSGTDNQTAATSTTVANVAEVKASRTLTVGALPAASETITVGTCVISFTDVASSTVDEVDCTDDAAAIDRDIGTGDVPRVATQTAEILRTLTNVSDAAHGALTVGGSDDTVSFTTSGAETSATAVTFTDGTSGDITSTASTAGIVAVAQVSTLTPANVEIGDIFTGIIDGTSYTATATAATVKNVVELLQPLMNANGAVTCTEDDTAVTCTADSAGTAFTITSSATDGAAVAQEATFTPGNVTVDETFNAIINSTTYSFQATVNTAQNVVEGLQPLMTANAAVTCTEDNVKVTCVADSAGTAFTYSVSVTEAPASGGGTLISFLEQMNEQRDEDQITTEAETSPGASGDTAAEEADEEAGKATLDQMAVDAGIIASGDIDQIISVMGAIRDLAAEAGYNKTIVAKVVADSGINAQIRDTIVNFVTYGTKATKVLGAGERAGVVNSFQAAFGKLPVNSSDWNDVIKIANGRWPNQRDALTEANAAVAFKKIYLRAPDRSDPHDDAAVTVISYGLRPADRNLDSEKAAIKSFEAIYGYAPVSAMAWDVVRAIAYSGATR